MTAYCTIWVVVFRIMMLYTVEVEAESSSDSLVTTYKTTGCHNPEDHNLNCHSREDVKSLILYHCYQSYEPILTFLCRKNSLLKTT
jgi:hypothetical protein